MRTLTKLSALIACAAMAATVRAGGPQYQIFDIGVIQVSDTASQGFGVSPGGIAVGRSVQGNSGSQAFTWTQGGGLVGLPNLAGRNHAVSNDANANGMVVGTAAITLFGSNRLPVMWQNGVVSQLPLPAGETIGDATGVNASGIAVGSVDGGSLQQGVIYNGSTATIITQTTTTGCTFVTAFGINNFGRIVGFGIDPNNAARNVGIVYDVGSNNAFEVGALPGHNGALAFGVSNNGHVVGSSMLNQGSGMPFIYSDAAGIRAIPLAAGTSEGSARAVNSAGWVVGQDSSAFSIPFLWDGGTTYRLADLLPPGSGWDLDMNTSSSALGISEDNIIVGTGVHNSETHGYAMVPVTGTPTPTPAIDLAVTMTDAPDPVPPGQNLTYTITVLNNVPDTALNVTMTDALPPGVSFVSVTPSQGSCSGTSTVTCNLGTIQGSSKATIILVVDPFNFNVPKIGGLPMTAIQLTNTANVPFPGDPNPSNNSATEVTTILPNPTPTATATATVTVAPSPTPTATATATASASATPTLTPTPTPTTTPTPTPTTTPASPTPTASAAAQSMNLSTRLRVQTGANVGVGGFIITGSAPKRVLLRGIGPSLTGFGVPDALADPVIELHGPTGFTAITNDNWRDTQESEIQATGIPPSDNLESAIIATLDPGAYTGIVIGKDNTTGVALIEAYDLNQAAASKLANISTRAFVSTGSNVVIAGFILGGNTAGASIVLRGIGPSLTAFGIPDPLANPTLELRDGNGVLLASNDNWQDDPTQAVIITAAGLAPDNAVESAIAATLSPGQYTALLAGRNNGTGVGLVEVYNLGTP